MTYKLSARSYERLKGVDNRIFNIIELALTITAIDFGIPKYGGLRTASDQRNLFKTGATKCDGIENKSEHQSGLAFDIYAYVDGKASWDRGHLTQVAAALLQAAALLGYGLEWGAHWKSWQDFPHFQLKVISGKDQINKDARKKLDIAMIPWFIPDDRVWVRDTRLSNQQKKLLLGLGFCLSASESCYILNLNKG